MSKLEPFKAYFTYSFVGNFKDCFDEIIWSRLFDKYPKRDVKTIIHNNSVSFNIPYIKKGTKINLDFEQIHSVFPIEITKSNYNCQVEFKFNSKPITVLQIDKDIITFSNEKSEVLTITMTDDLTLIRL